MTTTYNYDDKNIEVEGYIHVGSVSFGNKLKVTSGGTDTRYGVVGSVILEGVELQTEGKENSIIMKSKQTRDEIELFDNSGKKFGLNDKVKISGTVKYINRDKDFSYRIINTTLERLN